MNDKELLCFAAKAAGYGGCWIERYPEFKIWDIETEHLIKCPWNPLADDGDALRLAVKLQFGIFTPKTYKEAEVWPTGLPRVVEEDSDHYAATRRAIVRAAAEIGKGL